jgi:RimJ/RimL family protein N-acetyltransferase
MADDPFTHYLLSAYPKKLELDDETALTVRPLIPQDRAQIGEFFERVPQEDRVFLKEHLLNREEVEIWLDEVDIDRETVMVAVAAGGGRAGEPRPEQIVGTAILERQLRGWSRHVGEIRIVADPDFRRRGLGHRLAETIFDLAKHSGLEKLFALMMADEPGPIRVFKRLGFRTEATLNDQVKDWRGRPHDMLVMAYYMDR